MLRDFRYALRTLRQNPGFALVAIISLALGIGANAAMFSFADALLLRPLAVPDASGLVRVQTLSRGQSIARFENYFDVSYPDYRDLRDKNRSFVGLSAAQFASFGLATQKGELPQMKFGELVSGNFFHVLGVHPALGRGFRDDEDRVRGRNAVTVLGYDLWKTEFAGSPDVLGREVYLNGIPFTVVGVTPEEFAGSNNLVRSALFVPLAMGPRLGGEARQSTLDQRDMPALTVRGRLRPGTGLAAAAAETRVIGQQLAQAYPATNRANSLVASTDRAAAMHRDQIDALLVFFLLGLAVVVLLIACANVTNLMLSRAQARAKEIAVRLAIGAGRARLIRQLLTESLVIAALGAGAGLLVAEAGIDLFSQLRIPSAIPVVIDVKLDQRVLLFTLLVALASALLFGLVPALRTASPDLVPALKSGKAGGARRRRLMGRNGLVVAQVAGSLVLLIFATQAFRGAAKVLNAPAGFRTDHVLIASFDPTLARYTPAATQTFYDHLLEKVRSLRGVKTAALAEDVPMGVNGGGSRIVPEGVSMPPGADALLVLSNHVSDEYFETLGIPIVEGRGFLKTDRADTPLVAVVNEQFARKYYPGKSAVGKRLRVTGPDGGMAEIVGVARRSKYAFVVEPPLEFLYLPASQSPRAGMTLLLETEGPPGEMAAPLRDAVRSLDASQPMFGVNTMQDFFDQRARKMLDVLTQVIAGMGLLGLAIALVGLYGLMTYSVGLRQREIGIRIAIGAEPAGVLRMLLRHGLVLAGAGIGVGLLLSAAASRALTTGLGMPSFNLVLVAAVALALLAATAAGALIPARRASLTDPNLVLRQE